MTSAIIGALVAIIIFSFGRYLEKRRAETALLRGKLEDYFKSLNKIKSSFRLPDLRSGMSREEHHKIYLDRVREVGILIDESKVYAEFYFSETLPRFEKLINALTKGKICMVELSDSSVPPEYDELFSSVDDIMERLKCLQNYIIINKGDLIKANFYWP